MPRLLRFATLAAAFAMTAGGVAAQPADPVVGRVNGREILRSDVENAQRALPIQYRQIPFETIFPSLLEQVVSGALLVEAARTDKLIEAPDVKLRLRQAEDRILQEAFLSRLVQSAASEERMKTEYDQLVKDNPPREEVSARHILVEKEEQAKAVIRELEKGADFAKLAKEKSTDPAAQSGGDLGFFGKEDMVPDFAAAAFALKKGEFTKTPVKTQFGYHVIKLEDRRTAAAPTFDEAKEEIQSRIAQGVITETIAKLRQTAKIEAFQLDGTTPLDLSKQ